MLIAVLMAAVALPGAAIPVASQTEPTYLRCIKADGVEIGVFRVFENNLWEWQPSQGSWLPVGFASNAAQTIGSQYFESPQSYSVVSYIGESIFHTKIDRVSGSYYFGSPTETVTGTCEPTREPRPAATRF